jgi:pimeloyl-ACP methyl ester carboxylesterase
MPGFGLSDIREEYWPTGFESHIDFIQEFSTALCLERFHIAGNSLGCYNSVSYLVAHPERVISFALIAGSVGDLVPFAEQVKNVQQPPPFDGTEEWMRRSMATIIHHDDALTDDLIKMRTAMANRTRDAYAQWIRMSSRLFFASEEEPDLVARFRTKDRFDRMTIPGIYIWGTADSLNPVEQAYAQEDALPAVQFFYPNDTGHQAQTDSPELVNQLFLEFFRDGRVSWKTATRSGISGRRAPNGALVEVPFGGGPVEPTGNPP